ncbi:sporulation peptidase YabG, partial [Aneurinibacillus sp. UBA3580]
MFTNPKFKLGDIVTRKSHGYDMLFQIIEIDEEHKTAALIGLDYRLIADAPLSDLVKVNEDEMKKMRSVCEQKHIEAMRLIQQE